MKVVLALIHSPLVGSMAWAPVPQVLRARGVETIVSMLRDVEGSAAPYWAHHAAAGAERLEPVPAEEAQRNGWPICDLAAGRFHMLVDPEGVAEAIWDVAREELT